MNVLDEYKELYYKEIETTDRLNNKIGTHTTFLTVIATAEILLWKDVFTLDKVWWIWIYIILNSLSLLTFTICAYYFYKSYTGYKYLYINPQETKKFIDKATEYALENDISEEKTNKYISDMFLRSFSKFGIENHHLNIQKNKYQYKFTKWMCISFLIIAIAYSFWIVVVNPYNINNESEKTYKIQIERRAVSMPDNENEFPIDLQPDPSASVFHETFNRKVETGEIRHSDDSGKTPDNTQPKSKEN